MLIGRVLYLSTSPIGVSVGMLNVIEYIDFKNMGGGAKYCTPPPSMKNDNIHERISERYLLSVDIKYTIIQLYRIIPKSELLNILLKDINGTFSIQCDGIQDISGSEQDIFMFRYLT